MEWKVSVTMENAWGLHACIEGNTCDSSEKTTGSGEKKRVGPHRQFLLLWVSARYLSAWRYRSFIRVQVFSFLGVYFVFRRGGIVFLSPRSSSLRCDAMPQGSDTLHKGRE
jgi:hypothetical protein